MLLVMIVHVFNVCYVHRVVVFGTALGIFAFDVVGVCLLDIVFCYQMLWLVVSAWCVRLNLFGHVVVVVFSMATLQANARLHRHTNNWWACELGSFVFDVFRYIGVFLPRCWLLCFVLYSLYV